MILNANIRLSLFVYTYCDNGGASRKTSSINNIKNPAKALIHHQKTRTNAPVLHNILLRIISVERGKFSLFSCNLTQDEVSLHLLKLSI